MPAPCPNAACPSYQSAPAAVRKNGRRRTKHGLVQRYQCAACGTTWSQTTTDGQHRPDLNRSILALAVSGVSIRRMAKLLGTTTGTVQKKIAHLAGRAQEAHRSALVGMSTSHVMLDDLETFLHARYKQVAIPVIVRVKTREILGFAIARHPPNMKKHRANDERPWAIEERPEVLCGLLAWIAPCLRFDATITTDGALYYREAISQVLPDVRHQVVSSPKKKSGEAVLHTTNSEWDPLFAINHTFAKMRHDLPRLSRRTWITTKSEAALRQHLWLWVAWNNRYEVG